ncbi:hypothetical protein ACODYM_28800 [Burkholderia gladioli]|uniref:hypothetical protein n=1 Tax=Burkholderia gladioli TaxID=28095 RepID=UPI003B50A459
MEANDLPTIQEELDRKSIETLEWLITSRDNGRISSQQLKTGLDALFMTVSGLTPEDFTTLVTEASMMLDRPASVVVQKAVFFDPDKLVHFRVLWSVDTSIVEVEKSSAGQPEVRKRTDCGTSRDAMGKFAATVSFFRSRSLVEL